MNINSSNLFNSAKIETNVAARENNEKKKNSYKYIQQQHKIKKNKHNLMNSQDNTYSHNSSNQQKSSDTSYNLNYIINNLNNNGTGQAMKPNEEYIFQQNPKNNQNKTNSSEIEFHNSNSGVIFSNLAGNAHGRDGYMKYNANYPYCIPVQMNQTFSQQSSINHYSAGNTSGKTIPILYPYGNMNQNNSLNYSQQNNMNVLPKNIYLQQNPTPPAPISQNTTQQNYNQNYELVPNYMLAPNNNNSYQIVQVGMSLRPVQQQNVLVISSDRLQPMPQPMPRNNNMQNMQGPSYVFYPINNVIPNQGPNPVNITQNNIDETISHH